MSRTSGGGARLVVALVVTLGVAVGSATIQAAAPASDPPVTIVAEATTAAPGGTDVEIASEWEQVVPGGDCECADGSEFSFFVKRADPTKVVFFLEGGGACFNAETCAFGDPETSTYAWRIDNDDFAGGILDLGDPDNPFAGYSVVFVPYCTGDVHIGNATTEYSPDLTVQHKGAVNGAAAVAYLAEEFPDAERVVVVGESAGGVAAPLYGGLVADAVPDADVVVFADGAGGYPDVPAINELIGEAWGTMDAVPDWPVNEGMTTTTWSLPGLWVQAGTHDPDIVMSRFDFAFDEVQVFFAGLAGVEADMLVDFMDENEARVEAAGVEQASFTAPGDHHTLVRNDEFYTMEVAGVRLVDWLAGVIAGEEVADVHCVDCEAPPG